MVERSPKITASEEEATTTRPADLPWSSPISVVGFAKAICPTRIRIKSLCPSESPNLNSISEFPQGQGSGLGPSESPNLYSISLNSQRDKDQVKPSEFPNLYSISLNFHRDNDQVSVPLIPQISIVSL